jgi:glycosyltransferase involved in cell wall biosynthesis
MALEQGSVWLDARGAQSVAHADRGIPRQVAEHTLALVATAPDSIGWIGLDPDLPIPRSLEPLQETGLFAWHERSPSGDRRPAIYHVMSPFEAERDLEEIWPEWVRETECRLVVTLHDLIPIVMREQYLAAWGSWATAWVARAGLMRFAQRVLTVSRHTAADAMELLGIPEERITVIDAGVSDRFSSLVGSRAEGEALVRSELRKVRPGFLLYVGGTDPRKNLEGTVRAYAELPADLRSKHQLVIVGKIAPLRRLELQALARRLGIARGGLVLTGFVSDRLLAALYRSCALFVFSSLYEGTGLPILEAMSCDAPVAASGVSAMPELLGDREATFEPADPADMARALREVLETRGKLESLVERSRRQVGIYTWERVARRTVEGYERALEAPLDPAARGEPPELLSL